MVGGEQQELLQTSSICIILNTPPNSDCSPILITTPCGKTHLSLSRSSPLTHTHSHTTLTRTHTHTPLTLTHHTHTHTFPWPLHTKVPMNATFFSCEISFLSTDCGWVCLREGSVSPVKLDSSISRSTACKRQTGSFRKSSRQPYNPNLHESNVGRYTVTERDVHNVP